jgi:hypothetical protein
MDKITIQKPNVTVPVFMVKTRTVVIYAGDHCRLLIQTLSVSRYKLALFGNQFVVELAPDSKNDPDRDKTTRKTIF